MPSFRFRSLFDAACRIFSVSALSICALELMIASDDPFINPLSFLLLFPFALCLGGADMIFRNKAISAGVRFLAHFSLLSAGVFLFLFWPAGIFASGKSAITLIFVYLLLYFVLMLAAALFRHALRRRTADYSALYDTKNGKK